MRSADQEEKINQATELLRRANNAVVFTGAGISTPSGIPDFRSAGSGLWAKNDPMQVASLTAFRFRPQVFYDWLRPLAASIRGAQPNAAHLALARLEQAGVIKAVITQNIDGLHHAAGSHTVLAVHGSLTELVCLHCHRHFPSSQFWDAFVDEGITPRCPTDSRNLKPDFVLFEEMLPEQTWSDAETACARADLIMVIGSSLEVGPANMLPVTAVQAGADLIIITRSPTFLDQHATLRFEDDIADVVPAITERVLWDQ